MYKKGDLVSLGHPDHQKHIVSNDLMLVVSVNKGNKHQKYRCLLTDGRVLDFFLQNAELILRIVRRIDSKE
jgi:hypothetical protein